MERETPASKLPTNSWEAFVRLENPVSDAREEKIQHAIFHRKMEKNIKIVISVPV
jgi:hypothetical protein